MPGDDEKNDDEGESIEDKNISAFEVSEENPFLIGWTNCVKNASFHPRNDESTEANATNTTPNRFLVDKMPTEAMTKNP